ncbi:MAG: dTDP-6-deoxy-L-talose 4-dehydrogenase (NAD(+)) [Desulfovibrio sp.]
MKSILVTGASGFIGRHVVAKLHSMGKEVVGLAQKKPDDSNAICWHTCDLFTPPYAFNFNCVPDICIHLAWPIGSSYADNAANTDGLKASIALFELLAQSGCKHFVIAGTCAEYGTPEHLPVDETAFPNPDTLYAASKNELRHAIDARINHHPGVTVAWARIFQLYGRGERSSRLFPSMAKEFLQNRAFPAASGTQIRDYLHVCDVASALVRLAEHPVTGIYNISSSIPIQLADLMRMFASYFGPQAAIEFNAKKERLGGWDPPAMYGENTKLRALGWSPSITLEEGLKTYANFLRTGLANPQLGISNDSCLPI